MITLHLSDDEVNSIIRAAKKDSSLAILAMKLIALRISHVPDANGIIEKQAVPEADTISYGTCANPVCDHLHLILYNTKKEPIASAACGEDMLSEMLNMLRSR